MEKGLEKKYSLGLYEKAMPSELSWEEKLLAAKEAGYDFVEISIDETAEKLGRLDMSEKERQQLLLTMQKTGMPIRTMCLSGHRKYSLGSSSPATCARGMEIIDKAIRLADDLGIRMIQLAGYDVYYEESTAETKKRFLENLKNVVHHAGCVGVYLGFETMETEFMNTVEKAMKYVILVNSSYLQIYPDIGNLTNAACTYKNDVLEDLELGRGHLLAMHLKETSLGKFREVPYGSGHVAFEAAIGKAWELQVRKFVTEFWYTGSSNWREDLISSNRKFSKILNQMQ